jgi:two-component system, response regulator YesN
MSEAMIKTLLVDDEYLIRELLKGSVDFHALGFELVGEAEDGLQAVEKTSELAPHLLILDINIPLLNGVEVAKVLREQFPALKIIVLTGFEEFSYAREFIRIGVFDYILKPIEPEKFQVRLLEVKSSIEADMSERAEREQLQRAFELGSELHFNRFIAALLEGRLPPEHAIKEQLGAFGSCLGSQNLCVVTVELDPPHRAHAIDIAGEQLLQPLCDLFQTQGASHCALVARLEMANRIACILNAQTSAASDVLALCHRLQTDVSRKFEHTISLGVSSLRDGYRAIPALYQESVTALEERFFRGGNLLVAYQELTSAFSTRDPRLIKEKPDVLVLLRSEDQAGLAQFLQSLYQEIVRAHPPVDMVYALYIELYTKLIEYIWEHNLAVEEVIVDAERGVQAIRLHKTLDALHHWMLELSTSVLRQVRSKSRSRSTQIVDKARRFIEEHYFRAELSMAEVSERMFVNPTYLSKVFKRDLGCSMVEYLMNLRMRKAKELMDSSNAVNVSEVAFRVGYSDPFYFSKLFKKEFGVSPSSYLERKHRR